VIERLVDAAARELGIAPDVLRRRNFIKPKAMPYATATGRVYDTGDFAGHMARAQELAEWDRFKQRAAAAKRKRRLRGIGLSTYIEACGSMGPDTATVTLEPDGSITALMGSQSSGQGHETSYAQIIADHLGVPPDRVRVIQGDTERIATGTGTGGSSSIPCGGASLAGAARKLALNIKRLAADSLEASIEDLELFNGFVRVKGTDKALLIAELAKQAAASPEQLTASDAFAPQAPTYPNGTHLAEVEIDPETGAVEIVNYVVVDDFGVALNPLLLAGQVHGGTVQGIGQALMEQTVYAPDSGQLVTASLMDYALPRAENAPAFTFETRNVPCANNPLGVKGAGEAGAIGSCPAVMNAVVDALWRAYRIDHIDMPATPERIWAGIAEHHRRLRM
jgi:carbon-monoxide dehydrogenase large subunit